MQSSRLLATAALAFAAVGTATVAQAGDRVHFSVGAHIAPGVVLSASNAPYYYYGAPRYVVPAPVYYYAPAPVYYAPPTYYYRPHTVVISGHGYYGHHHHHHHHRRGHHRHHH